MDTVCKWAQLTACQQDTHTNIYPTKKSDNVSEHFLLMRRVLKGDISSEAGDREVSNLYILPRAALPACQQGPRKVAQFYEIIKLIH